MIIENKRGSKMNRKRRIDDHCPRRALARLPSASSAARHRLLLLAMLLGFALVGKRRLETGEDLRAKGLVESWGHLRFSFIGLARQIVASGHSSGSWCISQENWKVERLLTPKFGKESDLWVRLDEESVRWKEGFFFRCIRQRDLRSAICFRSAKEQLS
jgi:hypothetical protein